MKVRLITGSGQMIGQHDFEIPRRVDKRPAVIIYGSGTFRHDGVVDYGVHLYRECEAYELTPDNADLVQRP